MVIEDGQSFFLVGGKPYARRALKEERRGEKDKGGTEQNVEQGLFHTPPAI